MKNYLFLSLFLVTASIQAQVGINTQTPDATLDVEGKAATTTIADGIIPPRITKQELAAKSSGIYGFYQTGALVYVTNTTTPTGTIPSIAQVAGITNIGYYYFNGSAWIAVGDSTSDAFVNNVANTKVELGTKSDGSTARTAGTEFSIQDNGAVVVGTSAAADASSVLDMSAITNKGILIPQVALVSNTDQVTVASPKIGLLVYNTGLGSLKTVGYFFWNGSEWRTLYNTSSINAAIVALDCVNAKANPVSFSSTTPYSGTLSVPYVGGNGGSYTGGTSFSSNGLTFILQPGVLANGTGSFTYSISGTPSFSSPSTVSVAIPALLGATGCSVSIGDTGIVKTLQFAKNSISPIDGTTVAKSVTTIGNISVRLNANAGTASGTIFEYRLNNGITSWVTDNANWGGQGGRTINYHQFNGPDSRATNTWFPMAPSVNIGNSDSFVTYISLLNTKEIYRVSAVMNNNIAAAPTTGGSGVTIFIEKLD
ncbi:hypothetical protein [Chryseobacterium sp. SIMBA_029]|uniref:hypothetical protein n=2 Tax=Pseudomonadati TaxID=3379134 RepID=UPI00397B93D9